MKNKTLQINDNAVLKLLSSAFSSPMTVISELLQNSRRANASQIKIHLHANGLTISDDGCGIDDLQNLFTLGQSGWSEEVMETQSPFGFGFLSALFSAKEINISSNFGSAAIVTQDLLEFKPYHVSPSTTAKTPGTEITLFNIQLPENFSQELEFLTWGFPIPVLFKDTSRQTDPNKEVPFSPLSRRHSMNYQGHGQPNKFVHIDGLGDLCINYSLDERIKPKLYLQGLPVNLAWQDSYMCLSYNGILHLDNSFKARMPDRDALLNPKEAQALIVEKITAYRTKFFTDLAETSADGDLLMYYKVLKFLGISELLNGELSLPRELLQVIDESPNVTSYNWDSGRSLPRRNVTEACILESGVYTVDNLDTLLEGNLEQLFIHQRGGYLLPELSGGDLDEGHWVYKHARGVSNPSISSMNPQRVSFAGIFTEFTVCLVDSYILQVDLTDSSGNMTQEVVEVNDQPAWLGEDCGGVLYLPRAIALQENLLRKVSRYEDEYSCFQDTAYEGDSRAFLRLMQISLSNNPVEAMEMLLPSFIGIPGVAGKTFTIRLYDNGALAEVIEVVGN